MRMILLLTLALTACAGPSGNDGASGAPGPSGPTGPVATPAPLPNLDSVADVMQEYNEGRVAVGQDPVTAGLACTLYTVPNTTTQISGATLTTVGSWTYTGVFNVANGNSSPGVNIMPSAIQSLYTSYYIIKCTGLYAQAAPGFITMDSSSDDGLIVNLNGVYLNNDGVHGVSTKSATKYLNRGVYSFELDYLDIGGSHALILSSGGVPVSGVFFH